jgi:hypothetical protein
LERVFFSACISHKNDVLSSSLSTEDNQHPKEIIMVELYANITCPECEHTHQEQMPENY